MQNSSLWNNFKNYIYKKYGCESGTMLVHAGVLTWLTATASQVFAVAKNDKIPAEQKKFLVPQEIADGAINILTFYLITSSVKNMAGKLASTGKWSTKAIRDFVKKEAPEIKLGDYTTNLSKKFRENVEFHQCYDSFKGGLDMTAATVGSVLSCNLAVPFVRNHWGAKRQKESLQKEQILKNQSIQPKIGLKV